MGDLFDIENTLSFNTDKLVEGKSYDYVTRTSTNQGILQSTGFVNKENINKSGVWSLGLLQMDFFYRKKEWYAGQFVRKVIPKISIPENCISFFTTMLNKQKPKLLPVLVRHVDSTFRNIKIQLPVTVNGELNFSFMEDFIAELEQARIAELEAYLVATGLSDYILMDEEEQVLQLFKQNKIKLNWSIFNLEKLFGKSTRGKRLKSADRISGKLPFVTAGEAEEGISALIGNDVAVFDRNTTTIDMFGSAKYRNFEYGADDHVAVVHTENLNKYASIFVTTAIHKSSHNGQFDYSKNFYAKDADELSISLPSIDSKPDYEFMKTFISAMQKLVIKDVVLYADAKVNATKKVVSNQINLKT